MIFQFKSSNCDSLMEIRNDEYILLKGSKIRTDCTESFKVHATGYYKIWFDIKNNYLDTNGILTKDYPLKSAFACGSVSQANMLQTTDVWKTIEGNKKYSEVISEDVTLDSNEDKTEYLNLFLQDIDCLNDLNKETTFNVFETLAIERKEIRHSNVLGWLMDPNETHRMGDDFLKKLIREIYKNNKEVYKHMNIDEIFLWDFDSAIVKREKDNIDILVVDDHNKFVLVIENKIDSKESVHQLIKYKDNIDSKYPEYKKMYLFLTKFGDTPSDTLSWGTYSYQEILDNLLHDTLELTTGRIKDFINDYINILRRHIVKNDEIQKICEKIYSKHKKALDLLFEYKPDYTLSINDYLKSIINKDANLELVHSIKSIVRFTTPSLDKINNHYKEQSGSWVKEKLVILYELSITNDEVTLYTVVGPTLDSSRNEINDYYFNKHSLPKPKGNKWTVLRKENICKFKEEDSLDDICDNIDKTIHSKIKKQVSHIDETFKSFL